MIKLLFKLFFSRYSATIILGCRVLSFHPNFFLRKFLELTDDPATEWVKNHCIKMSLYHFQGKSNNSRQELIPTGKLMIRDGKIHVLYFGRCLWEK